MTGTSAQARAGTASPYDVVNRSAPVRREGLLWHIANPEGDLALCATPVDEPSVVEVRHPVSLRGRTARSLVCLGSTALLVTDRPARQTSRAALVGLDDLAVRDLGPCKGVGVTGPDGVLVSLAEGWVMVGQDGVVRPARVAPRGVVPVAMSPDGRCVGRAIRSNWEQRLVVIEPNGRLRPLRIPPGLWEPCGAHADRGLLVRTDYRTDRPALRWLSWAGSIGPTLPGTEGVEHVAVGRDALVTSAVGPDGVERLSHRHLDGRATSTIDHPATSTAGIAYGPVHREFLAAVDAPSFVGEILAVDEADGRARVVVPAPRRAGSGVYSPVRTGPAQEWTVPAYRYGPPDAPAALVWFHGGPLARGRLDRGMNGLFADLAARGIATVAPDVRGSLGHGSAHARAVLGDWGGPDLEDALAVVDDVADRTGERVVVAGESYGGYLALLTAAARPGAVAGVTSLYGPTDLRRLRRAMTESTGTAFVDGWLGPDDPARLLARSPIQHAHLLPPTLLVHGTADWLVAVEHSTTLAEAMRKAGRTVELVVLSGRGHGFSDRNDWTGVLGNVAQFLAQAVSGQETAA